MADHTNIELRNDEVREILGTPPRWIIRRGISIIFFVILILLTGSYFYKYPDIIQSQITLTTENPPASLKSQAVGKITGLFAAEKQLVAKDEVIAIVENTANFQDVLRLKSMIDTLQNVEYFNNPLSLQLGDIQPYYSNFFRLIRDNKNQKELDYYNEKIKAVKQQIRDYKIYYDRLWIQRNLQEKELMIAQEQYDRDLGLFKKEVNSKVELEQAEKVLLQQKVTFENSRIALANTQMEINQLDQQILDLGLQQSQEEDRRRVAIEEAFDNFKSQVRKWEQTYLIVSPIDGFVTFTRFWSKNQNVQQGEIVATVIPQVASNIIGKVLILPSGVGKVKVGQTVNVKFYNYPFMEFGMLKGTVKSISLIPESTESGVVYIAEVEVPDDLVTNYGKKLVFTQEMTGTAEIITDELRLIQRFFNPIKSLFKEKVID